MTPVNVARKRNLFRRWLRYDGMKHKFVGVKVNPADYRKIGESGKLEFYTLVKWKQNNGLIMEKTLFIFLFVELKYAGGNIVH